MTTKAMPWSQRVRCMTHGCPNEGNEQTVALIRPAPGFVQLPPVRCAGCSLEPVTIGEALIQ